MNGENKRKKITSAKYVFDVHWYERDDGIQHDVKLKNRTEKKEMKLRYVGESFGVDSLTDGKIYEATEEDGFYRVIDDSGEDYLYSMTNPAPLDGSSEGGRWEIIED